MSSHTVSAAISLVLALLVMAAMQAFKSTLAASRPSTILGGFAGSNVFVFLLTAVSNFEMETMGQGFQASLIPEVVLCLGIAAFTSALVHRVCVTTCIMFSVGFVIVISKISARHYAPPMAMQASVSAKKKK